MVVIEVVLVECTVRIVGVCTVRVVVVRCTESKSGGSSREINSESSGSSSGGSSINRVQ